jgi:hypothetical protein
MKLMLNLALLFVKPFGVAVRNGQPSHSPRERGNFV